MGAQDILRCVAESRLSGCAPMTSARHTDEKLLHEIQVHQIELEMQNETLRQTQLELEKSRDRYLDLYDFAPICYLTLTPDAIISNINLIGAALLGVERNSLINSRFMRLIKPEYCDHWHRFFLGVLKDNTSHHCELELQRGDGKVFRAHLNCLCMKVDDGGNSVRVALTDITERTLAENKLRESENKSSIIFNKAVFPLALLHLPHAELTDVNEAWVQLFGYTKEEAIGKTPQELNICDDPAMLTHILAEIQQQGSVRDAELTSTTKSGNKRFLSVNMDLLESGKHQYVLSTIRDITDKKLTEMQLKEYQRLLRELAVEGMRSRETERKHIAREVHDELGQLLTALRMDISLLRIQFGQLDPVLMQKIKEMLALSDRIIQEVRNVALNLRPAVLDLGIVPAIRWLCNNFIGRRNTACTLKVSDDLDKEDCRIGMDDTSTVAIFRIVQESLTNVARHAKADNVEITIGRLNESVFVEVRDDGQGFYPVAAPTIKTLGLLGMQERAYAIGGNVKITGTPSKGTVVSIRIPTRGNLS